MDIDPEQIAYTPSTGVRRVHETPLVAASAESLAGYGRLVDNPREFPIEIVPWPAQGWRAIDANTGDQGGVTEGLFEFKWKGETLYARNHAVGDSYLFGWSNWPEEAAAERPVRPRERALIWRANYHPDGGQLFYPLKGQSFVVPLALPGDDVTPGKFVSFWCDGRSALYLHPNVSTARDGCTRASRSTSSPNSAAIWVRRCAGRSKKKTGAARRRSCVRSRPAA